MNPRAPGPRAPGPRAPGPRGSLLMGNLAAYKRDPIDMLLRLRRDYGDVVRNRLGPFLTHAVAHPDHVQYVLQENHRNYARGRFYDNFKPFFGDGLLTTEGDFWRRHRRVVQPGFHKRQIDAATAAVGAASLALVRHWRRLPDGGPVDAVPAMMQLSLAALGRMVFNTDISHTAETVGPAVRFGLEAMMPQGNHNDFIPRWMPTRFNRRIRFARSAIDQVIAQVIDAHREEQCETSDIISLLLAARDPQSGAPMSEREVHDEVMTVFLAGHETTGSGLSWALYALAQNPAVLRRLREELATRLDGRAPDSADFAHLPYLDQVVNEVLRVFPPIWGYTRDLIADDVIGGFHIPAGSTVFLSPYVTHRHPEFWSNPEAFDPENFAPRMAARHKYAFFPFGGGMRKCIGYQMALVIMRVVIGTFAQHLDLHIVSGHPIERGALVALRPLQGIQLMVRACRKPAAPPLAPPAEPARASNHSAPGIEGTALRFTCFALEAPPLPSPNPALAGKRIIIVNGSNSSAERVAQELARCCAHSHVFAPSPQEDAAKAASALIAQLGGADGIIDLGLEAPFALSSAAAWEAPMRRTLALLQGCYGSWLAEEQAARRFYLAVTWMDGKMGYGSGADQPLGGLWAGLAKTLPQELPNCNIRILDLAADEVANVGPRVAAELYRWGLFEIGYCGGQRFTLQPQQSQKLRQTPKLLLGAGDVVLFSGAARGIGLLCAKAIAQRYGSTIIVTGREAPPVGNEPWLALDKTGFKNFSQEQLRAATPDHPVVAIRRDLARIERRRALAATLADIAALGLPIEYRVCDVTDADAVQTLCDGIGENLRVVIHNAGIDRPVRLPQKTADEFIDTVRTKVLGFAHLCTAVQNRPGLLRFCNVGSLTGRWGGMTGETDYAAANEALARLGLWAQNHLHCPVKTLVWPTWDGVGMITNATVTKRYVATMPIEEGVAHWLAELEDDGSGEVGFMGAVGTAVTPIQIRGFSPLHGLANLAELATKHHHVGEPELFRPFARLVTRYRIARGSAPLLHAWQLDGKPALPASLLIEHACGAGAWITPDASRQMSLVGLADIAIDLDALNLPETDTDITLRTEAIGNWVGEEWHVTVRCWLLPAEAELSHLTLVHRDAPRASSAGIIACVHRFDQAEPLPTPAGLPGTWNDHLLRTAEWRQLSGDTALRIARVAPVDAADLWAVAQPPELKLPVNHLESLLRATWTNPRARHWQIGVISLATFRAADARFVIERGEDRFAITDESGTTLMDLEHVAMTAATASQLAA